MVVSERDLWAAEALKNGLRTLATVSTMSLLTPTLDSPPGRLKKWMPEAERDDISPWTVKKDLSLDFSPFGSGPLTRTIAGS